MKKSHAQSHWWDWSAIALLFILLHILAVRLVVTTWTPDLEFIQTFTSMGYGIGLALGYSQFKRNTARWISFGYMVVILPLIWVQVIDKQVELDERLLSVAGRLLHSISEFFARQPVKDPLFFVAIMSITFWIISASAGFNLARHQNFLAVVLPSAIGILIVQQYDNGILGHIWFLAFFIFFVLFLLGRLNFLQDQKHWRERRVFISPENSFDLTSTMAIIAGLLILTAWLVPLSITRIDTVQQAWARLTKPWTNFTDRMENAVSALQSSSPNRTGEFYGTELNLGNGFPLSDTVMFKVDVREPAFDQKPPRYYWRGRTYADFSNGQWHTVGITQKEYSPSTFNLAIDDTKNNSSTRFLFTVGASKFSLLYAPAQPIWVSRPGFFLSLPADKTLNVISWNATPTLLPGETYQVDAVLKNPNIEQLRAAGTQYPQWVTEKYLQLPDKFSPRIQGLAQEIAAQTQTPYDKATAITNYLRQNITYAPTIPDAPRNADRLEWILFQYKKGYCVYYATSEVLMLRSLGIPARLAVGFAEGIQSRNSLTTERTTYTVQNKNAHAWPEVYFPNIGWVEFEPTGNQAPLARPLAPRANTNPVGNLNHNPPPKPEPDSTDQPPDQKDTLNKNRPLLDSKLIRTLYLILFLSVFATLTIYLSRRYALPARVPTFVRATIERAGVSAPIWLIHWEHWSRLGPIERAFESINTSLRRLKQPAPIHATPVERTASLSNILPQLKIEIKVLLDEHQTSLYTSRVADEKRARRAAFQIRTKVSLALIRYFWTGRYE